MWKRNLLRLSLLLFAAGTGHAEAPDRLRWISIASDSPEVVQEIIRSEVDGRQAFSTAQEERASQSEVEREKEREEREYQSAIAAAAGEFTRGKKRMDEFTAQFQSASNEQAEALKRLQNTRVGIQNLEHEIARYEQDRQAQTEALKKWLKMEKHGEALVAVLYTRGFKDSVHELEGGADKASAPLLARHMGSYLDSFTRIIDNVLDREFIRTVEQGSCKWNNEEPLRMELARNERGTTYLRLKRYELYPFQTQSARPAAGGGVPAHPGSAVEIIDSRKKLEIFLVQNGQSANLGEWGRIETLIGNTVQADASAEEALKEQVKIFEERIQALVKRSAGAREDLETQKQQLRRREGEYHKLSMEVAAIRQKKELSEKQFLEAQLFLNEKKRSHESIIIKSAVVNAKPSQTPAEASAEAIMDRLADVKNDAKIQHSSTTTVVSNYQLSSEKTLQAASDARIVGLRLISFMNEGDSVRVRMAFRVKTVLEALPRQEPRPKLAAERLQPRPQPLPELRRKRPSEPLLPEPGPEPEPEPEPELPPDPAPVTAQGAPAGLLIPLSPEGGGGCRLTVRSIERGGDGLRLLVEVKNWDVSPRKVAFYGEDAGSWTKSSVHDAAGREHEVGKSFVVKGGQKTLMAELGDGGRVEIPPEQTVTVELLFDSCKEPGDKLKLNLHPVIYSGRRSYEEFDASYHYEFPGKGRAKMSASSAEPGSAPVTEKSRRPR